MGDIADMMLDGTLDEYTGEYMGEPCGYPRSYSNKRGYTKKKGQYGGVVNWLMLQGKPSIQKCNKTIRCYGSEILSIQFKSEHQKSTPQYDLDKWNYTHRVAIEIQKDFAKFKEWYKTYIDRHLTNQQNQVK